MARNMKCSTTGKDVHFAIAAAEKAAKHYGPNLRVYRCPSCRWWHLTKRWQPPARVEARPS